jgi:hypothetical protein
VNKKLGGKFTIKNVYEFCSWKSMGFTAPHPFTCFQPKYFMDHCSFLKKGSHQTCERKAGERQWEGEGHMKERRKRKKSYRSMLFFSYHFLVQLLIP